MQKGILILFICCSNLLFGQTPVLEAAVSKNTVAANEVFTYQVVSNTDCAITPPDFGNLEVVDGPMTSVSNQSSYINGVQTQVNQYAVTYYLSAPKKGSYTIPPA